MSTLQVLPQPRLRRILSEVRETLEALYGERLKGLYLFGSYARGEAEAESDIDVAVLLEGPVEPYVEIERTGEAIAALSLANDTVISLMFVSRDSFDDDWTPLLANLRREGVVV
jgi:predicted nucleotidyltransferase